MRRVRLWQCYNTESYNAGRRSLVFHHVRTVPLIIAAQLNVVYLESLVAHGGIRRLFVVGFTPERDDDNLIFLRIDPVSGRIELYWFVDENSGMPIAVGDSLLVTLLY